MKIDWLYVAEKMESVVLDSSRMHATQKFVWSTWGGSNANDISSVSRDVFVAEAEYFERHQVVSRYLLVIRNTLLQIREQKNRETYWEHLVEKHRQALELRRQRT